MAGLTASHFYIYKVQHLSVCTVNYRPIFLYVHVGNCRSFINVVQRLVNDILVYSSIVIGDSRPGVADSKKKVKFFVFSPKKLHKNKQIVYFALFKNNSRIVHEQFKKKQN